MAIKTLQSGANERDWLKHKNPDKKIMPQH